LYYLSFESPVTANLLLTAVAAAAAAWCLVRWWLGPPAGLARRVELYVIRGLVVVSLLAVLLNPVRVTESPGAVERPEMFYLVDSSQSMTLGEPASRFEDALSAMRDAARRAADSPVDIKLFRFGQRLLASESPDDSLFPHFASTAATTGSSGLLAAAYAGESGASAGPPQRRKATLAPTDADTQLITALRQISSRFGHAPPAGIVVFSDGRARDDADLETVVSPFRGLGVPVHVYPTGSLGKRGDVSIVAAVIPPRVRKFSEVEVQVFLRSFGFDGYRTQIELSIPASGNQPTQTLATLPVTLRSGFQTASLSFRTSTTSHPLRVSVPVADDEISDANNALTADVRIDRTKIRVLYLEGSQQPLSATVVQGRQVVRGVFSDVSQALMTDEDIECIVLTMAGGPSLARITEFGLERNRGFPATKAELAAFDAIILSDLPEYALTATQIEWIEEWVGQRGGGLLMAGGARSFSAGGWGDTKLADVLPVELLAGSDWNSSEEVQWKPLVDSDPHPIWRLYTEERRTEQALASIPAINGANRFAAVKPNLTLTLADGEIVGRAAHTATTTPAPPVTAVKKPPATGTLQDYFRKLTAPPTPATPGAAAERDSADSGVSAAVVIGRYGKGRTAALATPITPPWASEFNTNWKQGDQGNFPRFWRNLVYWLTENSSVGRRRLIATADKRFYSPGDEIVLATSAFNELAKQTKDYRIVAMIEPGGSLKDIISDYSPLKWPAGLTRTSGEEGPYIAWGEELELPLVADGEAPSYALTLALADALESGSANQSLRLELTAYEDLTQVDSTSLELQVLHDPFELQNPFPNHELLKQVAQLSGGRVLESPADLAGVLQAVPITVGPSVISKTPIWSSWLLWGWIITLLTAEWLWRRRIGLA
jgi:uncharacterized membrane protein